MRKLKIPVVSRTEELEKLILEYIGYNHAYSMNELYNRFCVHSIGVRLTFTNEELDQTLSQLLENEKLKDAGGGWFIRLRPVNQEDTEENLIYRSY